MAGAHHRGSYPKRAAQVRAQANANPSTRCWQCGRTKAEHQREWTAGHVQDGVPTSPLLAECAHCNYSRGAQHGARQRQGLQTTRSW